MLVMLSVVACDDVDEMAKKAREITIAAQQLFPWMFIFLFLFVALKYVIPFGNFVVIQLPISIIAYTIFFWLFATVGFTSFAIKGSLWVVVPIAVICFTLYFSRNYILLKLTVLNDRLTSKSNDPVKA